MKNNIFKKLAGIFITNKELGVLIILFIIAFGLLGFILMPKQYNPEIVAPAFRINTEFPGADQRAGSKSEASTDEERDCDGSSGAASESGPRGETSRRKKNPSVVRRNGHEWL